MTKMFFNYGVVSELALPLPECSRTLNAVVRVACSSLSPLEQVYRMDRHVWDEDVTPPMCCERHETKSGVVYDLVFEGYLRARMEEGSLEVRVAIESHDETTIAHLVLDQVLPRLLGQHGDLVLHGGAVTQNDSGALVFLGKTGTGKSTLCASYLDEGEQILSDDCVRVDPVSLMTQGSYPGLRLYPDSIKNTLGASSQTVPMASYTDKQRVDTGFENPGLVKEGAVPLRGIVLLEARGSDVTTEMLSGSEAVMALMEESFCLWPGDAGAAARRLSAISSVVASGIPVMRFSFPHDFHILPELKRGICDQL